MNERIKMLLEKAGASTGEYYRNLDEPNMSYSKSIVNDWSEDFKQQLRLEPYLRIREMDEDTLNKFATLIVCECIDVFSKDLPDPTSTEYKLGSLVEVTNRICKVVEHFGVQ